MVFIDFAQFALRRWWLFVLLGLAGIGIALIWGVITPRRYESAVTLQLDPSAAQPFRTLVVTSANPAEGKTVVASNPAIAFAQAGQRVLLVDADLRRPSLHTIFRVEDQHGFTQLLAASEADLAHRRSDGPRELDLTAAPTSAVAAVGGSVATGQGVRQAMAQTSWAVASGVENLTILPAGKIVDDPSTLYNAESVARLLARLGQAWDLVILDTVPVGPVADALLRATHADASVVVARAGRTRRAALRRVLNSLAQTGRPCLGLEVNDLRPGPLSRYGHYGYAYSYAYGKGYYGERRNGEARNGHYSAARPPARRPYNPSGAPKMTFTIADFQDLIRLLGEHPEWRAELRRHVLSEELLALPEQMRQLDQRLDQLAAHAEQLAAAQVRTQDRVEELATAQVRTEARLGQLAAAQQRTEEALLALTDRLDQLAEGLQRLRQEVGSLSELVGAGAEVEAERRLLAYLAARGYQLLATPEPVAVDGEVDVAAPVQDADGRRLWVLIEARARLHRADVAGWDRRLRDSAFLARLEREGISAPFLPFAFGLRIYRDAEEQGRASGIGILGPHGEPVEPLPRPT